MCAGGSGEEGSGEEIVTKKMATERPKLPLYEELVLAKLKKEREALRGEKQVTITSSTITQMHLCLRLAFISAIPSLTSAVI